MKYNTKPTGQEPRTSVGYKNPPCDTRFKAGQSGNPRGRPKRDKSDAEIFRDVAGEMIELTDTAGNVQRISRFEAVLTQLQNMAVGGNMGAVRILQKLRESFPHAEAEPKFQFIVIPKNRKV